MIGICIGEKTIEKKFGPKFYKCPHPLGEKFQIEKKIDFERFLSFTKHVSQHLTSIRDKKLRKNFWTPFFKNFTSVDTP